jgi:cytochrome c biogenesis protein CcmG, thiol:disulfide interchange protein DsbE
MITVMPRPFIVLLAIAVSLASCTRDDGTNAQACTPTGVISVGERIPDCSFASRTGEMVRLRSYEDLPLVLNFWASWCLACIKEMPALDEVATALEGRARVVGVDVVGVKGETRVAAERFLDATPVGYPILFDEGAGLYEHFATSKARPIMPVTIFVAPGGIVKLRRFGEMTADEIRRFIRESLGVA